VSTRVEINRKQLKAQLPAVHLPQGLIQAIVNLTVDSLIESERYDSRSERILLDADFDGDRYLLVKMPRARARAQVALSPRELEIVRMVAQGHSNKIIADVLNISSWTVCTHVRRIFAKLGVGSRAAMVAQLLECGISPAQVPVRPHPGLDNSSSEMAWNQDLRSPCDTADSRLSRRVRG
jgi:DNA-binding CsgD family transcriptional regulator